MTTKLSSAQNEVTRSSDRLDAAGRLALVRVTIGVMFICFFEHKGKGLYTPAGYTSLIRSYIKAGRSFTASSLLEDHSWQMGSVHDFRLQRG
jgi:hypothetical protein